MSPSKSLSTQSRRRDVANLRERRRMMLINRGFDLLKQRLPLVDQSCGKEATIRLTKVDILRMTIQYIKHLLAILDDDRTNSRELCPIELRARRSGRIARLHQSNNNKSGRPKRTKRSKRNDQCKLSQLSGEEFRQVATQAQANGMALVCRLERDGGMQNCGFSLSWFRVEQTTQNMYEEGQRKKLKNTKLWVPGRST